MNLSFTAEQKQFYKDEFVQVQGNHLLTASIMSAPAALSLSKVIYPETKATKANWEAIKESQSKKWF
jgi:nucleoside permease NupC